MSSGALVMLVLGCGFGAGLLLVLGALTGVLGRPGSGDGTAGAVPRFRSSRPSLAQSWLSREGRRGILRVIAGLAAGMVAWLLTGWPVAAILVAALLVGLPWLFGAGRVAQERIDRVDALASWCRRLRDMVAAGQSSITQAVRESAATAPAPIAREVTDLAQRVRTWEFADAVRRFADEIDDSIGDQIAAALIIAQQQGAGVARVLSTLAGSVDVEVAARRDIEAQRAGPRKTARVLIYIYLGLLGGLAVNGSYMEPYDTLLGQLVMAALTAMVLGSLVWLRQLSLSARPPRFLVDERGRRATPTEPQPTSGVAV